LKSELFLGNLRIKSEHPSHYDRDNFTFIWKCRLIVILACPESFLQADDKGGTTARKIPNKSE
jgi:hypothetical protein